MLHQSLPKRLYLLITLIATASLAAADISALGVMGDSLSDEYAEADYNYAFNWVEQLVIHRSVNVGPTAAGQPGGTWGEPRRRGYKFNWARSGADSQSLLAQGQHTGLAAQVIPENISHAAIMIGANDFAPVPFPGYAYFEIYNGRWSQNQINAYADQIAANINSAVSAVTAPGAQLVIATIPDYGSTALVRSFFPDPAKRERVTTAISLVNDRIETLAAGYQLVLVDIFAAGQAIFGTNAQPRNTLLIGNVVIDMNLSDTINNTRPHAAFVHDGVHPHTHLQGLIANIFALAMNIAYSGELILFTEEEILNHAGLAYGGQDTLEDEIGPYENFIRDYSCRADFNGDGVVNTLDFLAFLNAYNLADPAADFNGDGVVNTLDFLAFLNEFNVGC